MSLKQLVDSMTDVVVKRAEQGKNFGVALIPEGVIEFIPEMKTMIAQLNDTLAHVEQENAYKNLHGWPEKITFIKTKLAQANAEVFASLPESIQIQLLLDRDPHGNVQVSRIETDKLLSEMIQMKLVELKKENKYKGKFSALTHFFGYEGRCAAPSNFDADYCYSLGYNAFALVAFGFTGFISSIRNLIKPASEWIAGGIPLTMMMNMEKRHGEMKPVIKKALVELDGPVFRELEKNRTTWAQEDHYLFPGAIQYFGPSEVCDLVTRTLELEQQ